MEVNKIYQDDCLKILGEIIKPKSVDLIYADPPYNLSGKELNLKNNSTGGPFYKVNESWDSWSPDKYIEFTNNWISNCLEVLKDGGSFYVSCSYHNIDSIILSARKRGFRLNNIITWYKTNTMPNITKRTFTHSTEYICWFVKGNKWKFNYQDVKKVMDVRTKDGSLRQGRDFIELPLVQGKERLKSAFGRALHPTQKPEKLIELILIASSDKGDLVLDPFFGTGTTGVVAQRLGRKWIGIENNRNYFKAAYKRIFNN